MDRQLEGLFTAHYKDVYRYLYSLSHDASLSEDLAQEVFMAAARGIGAFRGEATAKTWLFSIARNKWYSHLRKHPRQTAPEILSEFLEAPVPSPEEQYHARETVSRIFQLLAQEPERTQRIVRMRLEGLSFCEIGAAAGVSESSARVIDFRARVKIRQQLKKEGFGCE